VIAFVRTPKPVEKEQEKLLLELKDLSIGHERRRDIGDRLSKIGDTRRGVGLDKDGLPDIEWLPVTPGGQLTIEKQTFTVQPFYIARYPVTYVQYEAFVKAKDGFDNPEWWRDMPKEYQLQKLKEQYQKSWNHPRDNVSWYQSVAFTRWLNSRLRGWQFPDLVNANGAKLIVGQDAQVRLPTELEWQWAAQGGSQQRKYPWGEWKDGYANTDKANLNRTVAVGMYPQGTAVCGAEDMSGNVLEWCLNEYSNPKDVAIDNGTNVLVLRGGAFLSNAYYAASAVRYDNFANSDDFRFGCRVVFCPPYPSVSDL
jgi:formylglycine-generating enzyme required for sulfatase activity